MFNRDCQCEKIGNQRLSNNALKGIIINPDVVSLLCDPITHEPLQLIDGLSENEALVNINSGKRFPVKGGITNFLTIQEIS